MKNVMRKCLAAVLTAGMLMAPAAGGLVVDGMTVSAAKKSSVISESKAKSIAMKDAKVKSSKVETIEAYLDGDKEDIYEVSFYVKVASRRYRHYLYRLESKTGMIKKKSNAVHKIITKKSAIREALDEEDLSRSEVEDVDCDLDVDDGKMVYMVSFTTKKESIDYDATVNAVTGNVIDIDDDDD